MHKTFYPPTCQVVDFGLRQISLELRSNVLHSVLYIVLQTKPLHDTKTRIHKVFSCHVTQVTDSNDTVSCSGKEHLYIQQIRLKD